MVQHRGLSLLALWAVLVTGLAASLLLPDYRSEARVAEGLPSPSDVVAPRAITYQSRLLTDRARAAAESAVAPVYGARDRETADRQQQRVADVLAFAGYVMANPYESVDEKRVELLNVPELAGLPVRQQGSLLALDQDAWARMAAEVPRLVKLQLRSIVTPDQVPVPPASLVDAVDPAMDGNLAELVANLSSAFIVPTVHVDDTLTAAARRSAGDAVQPVTASYAAGQSIVRAGDPVQAEQLEAMAQLGLLVRPVTWGHLMGLLALLAVLVGAAVGALYRSDSRVLERPRPLVLATLLILAFAAAARIAIPGHAVLAYVFPGAAVAMTMTVTGGLEMGLAAGAVLAVAVGLIGGSGLELATYVLVGGTVGAVVLGRVERLSAFLQAAVAVGLADLAVIAGFRLTEAPLDLRGAAELTAVAFGHGALCAGLAAVFVMASGPLFAITTSVQLLELARTDHPLLRRLQMQAPGTYQHSLLAGNLAEAAAAVVGADVLLVRVVSYYHDVGKCVRPLFFIENQLPGQNPHDDLEPESSARVVIAHVTDGEELARAHRLPQPIVDAIRQHHGTMRTEYFYQRALGEAGAAGVDESRFRYPGPRPRSREAAILMLADAAEAAVRASSPRTAADTAEVLERIFRLRLEAHQLDDCDLTLRDVQRIRDVFGDVLQSVFHPRIRYPEGVGPRREPTPQDAERP